MVLAAAGGEAFLKSILGAAVHLRVPEDRHHDAGGVRHLWPELTVSSVAALAGQPEIGLGDVLGGNVVNMALVFGLPLLFRAVQTTRQDFGNSFALALAAPCRPLSLFSTDGSNAPTHCCCWRYSSSGWCGPCAVLCASEKLTYTSRPPSFLPARACCLVCSASARQGIAAGRLFVSGATGVAAAFAVDTYVIGVVLVAVGTSLPELVTVILSRLCGRTMSASVR
ncbi:MAG: hypothetical protein IPF60_12890 [Betaproteobacteria bacterium]|nr:hypothetical protein [Betaproteobacteria bacterium]